MTTRDLQTVRLLSALHSGEARSQRALSRQLGIALGLTNVILRRVEACGWVQITRVGSNRARYSLTARGRAAQEELMRAQLQDSLSSYNAARDRILSKLAQLSRDWPAERIVDCGDTKAVLFYGAGEVAEIAYACLQRTDLTLAAVVDDDGGREFFGRPILPLDALSGAPLVPFGRIIVTSFGEVSAIRQKFADLGCPPEWLFWL